jgi:hypothetical protein
VDQLDRGGDLRVAEPEDTGFGNRVELGQADPEGLDE